MKDKYYKFFFSEKQKNSCKKEVLTDDGWKEYTEMMQNGESNWDDAVLIKSGFNCTLKINGIVQN